MRPGLIVGAFCQVCSSDCCAVARKLRKMGSIRSGASSARKCPQSSYRCTRQLERLSRHWSSSFSLKAMSFKPQNISAGLSANASRPSQIG